MKSNYFLRFFLMITRPINLALCMVLVISSFTLRPAVLANSTIPINEIYQVSSITNLWVDVASGNDGNNGLTPAAAFRTIQKAANIAGPGTMIHILPGIYRETIRPTQSGSAMEPIVYRAEGGPGTVVVRGSENSSALGWTQMTSDALGLPPGVNPTNIYVADLSSLNLTSAPRFVIELDDNGQVITRMPLAREPDWSVSTDWKYQEFWWVADGGSVKESCDPITNLNCDQASRSVNQLTDQTNDTKPTGVEAGNLRTLGDLTGGTLVAVDTVEGHYVYRRSITEHNIGVGTITVDEPCNFDYDPGNPSLGWGTKYYLEGKPYLLDSPGEWWYDTINKRLYLWPRISGNPGTQNIEISRLDNGFDLHNRSHITLESLNFEFFNKNTIDQDNWISDKSYGNTLRNLVLRYSNNGINIKQTVSINEAQSNVTDGFTLENSEIAYMDTFGVNLSQNWDGGSDPDLFNHSGLRNTTILNNEFHDLGFRSDDDTARGLGFEYADRLRFEGNHVYKIAHNGVQISSSVIQSAKTTGFNPSEIKTGDILVKDNLFEEACLNGSDCGGLKVWGSSPDNHVFRNFLITGNIFRNSFGWSYISEVRQKWTGENGSEIRGMGGFGLFLDQVSGIHVYRNIAYNNAYYGYTVYEHWSDGDLVFANNIAANSVYGMNLGGEDTDVPDPVNVEVINNIFANNEKFGIYLKKVVGPYANMDVDYNLYFNNGWLRNNQGGVMVIQISSWDEYLTLADVQRNTPWEVHGLEGDPIFWNYNLNDHDLHDGSWPDFHLQASGAYTINRGTTALPSSLIALLTEFGITDFKTEPIFDIGRYEAGFIILATPSGVGLNPGNTINYSVSLFPSDTPYTVNLSYVNPSPEYLTLGLSQIDLSGEQVSTFTVTDKHQGTLMPGEFFLIPITGEGAGFANTTYISCLIGGVKISLPVISK